MAADQSKLVAAALSRLERLRKSEAFDPNEPGSTPTPAQLEIIKDFGKVPIQWIASSNRCLVAGTLVHTSRGPVPIEDIRVGDTVYSENSEPIRVLEIHQNGPREVHQLTCRGQIWTEATADHVWLVEQYDSGYQSLGECQVPTRDLSSKYKVCRRYSSAPLGNISVPYTYTLGALLGDGCSRQKGVSYLTISSGTEAIPSRICQELGNVAYNRNHESNYNWTLRIDRDYIPYYREWCLGRYAHEKIVDMGTIQKWDRKSLLGLVAGLYDTEGSLTVPGAAHITNAAIRISMQAKSVIDALEYALQALWQVRPTRGVDSRDKYVNGPCHHVTITNPYDIRRILEELDPLIVSPQKKWNPRIATLGKRSYPDKVTLIPSAETRIADTYDITVDSPTNLYQLSNGLITHNSGKSQTCSRNIAWAITDTHPYWKMPDSWRDEGMLVLVTARTGKHIEESLWPKIRACLEPGTYKEVRIGNMLQRVEIKDTNHRLIFQSLENPNIARERLQSYDAHIAWLDELVDSPTLISELSLRVTTKGGYFLASFTPLVPAPAVKKMVDSAALPLSKKYVLRTLDNPVFSDPGKREILMASLSGLSAEEIRTRLEGEWSIGDSHVYHFSYEQHVRIPEGYSPLWRHLEAVDPALSSALGLTIWAENPNTSHWYCIHAEKIRGILEPESLVRAVQERTSKYNIARRVSDPHEVWYIQTAARLGISYMGVYKKNDRKGELIKGLQAAIGSRVYISPHCTDLIDEFQECRWSDKAAGKIVNGSKYHLLDSAQYAVDTLLKPDSNTIQVSSWDEYLYKANEKRKLVEHKRQQRKQRYRVHGGRRR